MSMNSKKILSMNLKFYREKYNLSQEKFAEKVGSNLVYINQLENCKRKPTTDMLDKIADGMNKNIDPKLKMTSSELLRYDPSHKTLFLFLFHFYHNISIYTHISYHQRNLLFQLLYYQFVYNMKMIERIGNNMLHHIILKILLPQLL